MIVPLLGVEVDDSIVIISIPRQHDVRNHACWDERRHICEWAAAEGVGLVMIDPVREDQWSVGVVGEAGAVALRLRWS